VRLEELPQELGYLLGIWDELPKSKKEAILLILIGEEVESEIIPW